MFDPIRIIYTVLQKKSHILVWEIIGINKCMFATITYLSPDSPVGGQEYLRGKQ